MGIRNILKIYLSFHAVFEWAVFFARLVKLTSRYVEFCGVDIGHPAVFFIFHSQVREHKVRLEDQALRPTRRFVSGRLSARVLINGRK